MRTASDPFTLSHDDKTGILSTSLRGFWTEDDRAKFGEAFRLKLERLRHGGRPFGLLLDLREFDVQSAANIDAISAASGSESDRRRAPTAVVARGALVKRQASRVLTLGEMKMFEGREEAMTWLRSRLAATA